MKILVGDILEMTQDTPWYRRGEIGIVIDSSENKNRRNTVRALIGRFGWYLTEGTYRHKTFTAEEAAHQPEKILKRILELQPDLQDQFICLRGV